MQLSKILLIGLPPVVLSKPVEDTAVEFAMTIMQHNPQALSNLQNIPVCGQMCLFDPSSRDSFAPKCVHFSGAERFACLCRSHAYQYKLDRCFKRQCSADERTTVVIT